MKKDVIYIDVEDDITNIVGKIKASPEKIIALVPPNRVGVLQSAVNMRLLKRTADQAKKRIVLISNNQSLMGLAGAASIPVARTLQSKPELVEVPVLKVDNDDVIDGGSLSVGELARTTAGEKESPAVDEVIGSSAVVTASAAAGRAATKASGVQKAGKKVKVPDFSTFRKKLALIIGAGVLLVGFLVWAILFAPRATVVISAKTTSATVDKNVNLVTGSTAGIGDDALKVIRQEQKQDLTVEFEATGEKEVGEKAKGQVRFTSDSFSALTRGIDIPAGTALTSSEGKVFYTDSSVTLNVSGNTKNTGVTAGDIGVSYNSQEGSVSGAPSGVSARFVGETSGGTSREVTVVSEEDVAKAAEKLNEKKDDSLRDKLEQSFGSSSVVIKESYKESRSDYQPSVAVGEEAGGTVTLKATVTGSMVAIDKVDIENYLKKNIEEEIADVKSQRIYENGSDDVKFAQFTDRDGKMTVRLTANGTVGPTIDENSVKEQAKGKTYGEIQSDLEAISGVDNVDIQFWPFWVRTVPNDTSKITVKFKLQDAS